MNREGLLFVLVILIVLLIAHLLIVPLSETSWSEPLFIQRKFGLAITLNTRNRLGWWIHVVLTIIFIVLLAMVLLDKS